MTYLMKPKQAKGRGGRTMKPLTIKQMAALYEGTGLTESAIRRAVVSGAIPSIRIGTKYLLLTENVEKFLRGE